MTYIKIADTLYPATIAGNMKDHTWDERPSKAITLEMSHDEANEIFVDNLEWSIIVQADTYVDENGETVTPDPEEYDNSDYCVAGSITDHRNGTLTVKMGKLTDLEETLSLIYGGVE